MRLREPLGGSRGNPRGRPALLPFKSLYKNPLGKPSQGNIRRISGNIYGIYKECITHISIDIYDITIDIHQYIHQTQAPPSAAPHFVCVSDGYTDGYLWLYHKYLWIYQLYIPYIFHIYFLDMFHVFSLVCFLIYGVKRRQVLIAKPRFYFLFFQILYLLYFINNFMTFH